MQQSPPFLAPPGAGIPLVQRLALRYLVKPLKLRSVTFDEAERLWLEANAKLTKELGGIPRFDVTTRVLVPPQRGLEDSSRFWSVAMTARHLTIVGAGIEQLIVGLSEGRTDLPSADTAGVKPELERNHSAAIDEYLNLSRDFHTRLRSAVANKESAATHPHPWFGAMNLRQWYWLMSTHTQIHRKQIREICKHP